MKQAASAAEQRVKSPLCLMSCIKQTVHGRNLPRRVGAAFSECEFDYQNLLSADAICM